MKVEDIKRRDRWACKPCKRRFVPLSVYHISVGVVVDANSKLINSEEYDLITLCDACLATISLDPEKYVATLRSLLKENKVVLLGDIHGKFNKLDEILTNEEPFNFAITTGDLGNPNIKIIEKWYDKIFQILGDDDNENLLQLLSLHGNVNGINIAAPSGMIKSRTFIKDTNKNISFREILYLSHLQDGVDILVTHQAPSGILAENIGEGVLKELLNYLVPKIYIFGHLHQFKLKFYLQTFCISLPMINRTYAVAYFQGRELRNLELVMKKGKKVIRV